MYSRNPATAKKVEHHLNLLLGQELVSWQVEKGEARVFAYKLREALWIIQQNPQLFPELGIIASLVQITVDEKLSRVHGRVLKAIPDPIEITATISNGTATGPKHLVGVRTLPQVVEWFLKNQPTNDSLTLPDADLDDADLGMLYGFLHSRSPSWHIIRPQGAPIQLIPAGAVYAHSAEWFPYSK